MARDTTLENRLEGCRDDKGKPCRPTLVQLRMSLTQSGAESIAEDILDELPYIDLTDRAQAQRKIARVIRDLRGRP